ncbi:MAG TPA: carboxypeptidase-like regulatory domain-containing protein, partial [Thermoanaerobaculia bacterium]
MRKPAIAFALSASLTICAAAHAAITGSVVDLEGKPIAGATVRAFAAEGSDAMRARLVAGKIERDPVASVQSAENGSFSIELKTPGAVDLTVDAPSHRRTTIATVDGDDLGSVVLALPSTRTVRITSGGKPVSNAIVVSGLDVERTNASGEVPAEIGGTYIVVHSDYAISARGGLANATEIKL